MPQSLSQVWLHIVFSTKDRLPFLQNPEFRDEMFRMLSHHVSEAGCYPYRSGGWKRRSFQDEFRELCRKNEVQFDERYVWD